jgi:hypothetical protein
MGRRSRKRGDSTRAERDAARAATRAASSAPRRKTSDRPEAPWGNFPLSELVILLGLVLILWGAARGSGGEEMLAGGLVIASLGGGELALREHLAGYRSHTSLLAGVAAFVAVTIIALGFGPVKITILIAVGALVFAGTFYAMRELFKRRSGGLGFR